MLANTDITCGCVFMQAPHRMESQDSGASAAPQFPQPLMLPSLGLLPLGSGMLPIPDALRADIQGVTAGCCTRCPSLMLLVSTVV